jgi:hypothetical protein
MRKEARLLLDKAVNSLILSIDHFNRLDDRGRTEAVLILLDHAFEMLLKASIVHRGGKIRETGVQQAIGFDRCIRKGLSEGGVKFLTEEQALTLQIINGLRNAAQHYMLDINEGLLYIQAQSGITLFADLLLKVFGQELVKRLPVRALPVSTEPLTDVSILFANEVRAISRLLQPGRRKRTEALARLRPLKIIDATLQGSKVQPQESDLVRLAGQVAKGVPWETIFPGLSAISFSIDPSPLYINLRLTKKEGIPVTTVPEGTSGASVIGIKRVTELDFYNLGRDDLARKLSLSGPKTTAIIWALKLKGNPDYHKSIAIGGSRFDRYSQRAIDAIREALKGRTDDDYWKRYCAARKNEDNP